MSFGIYVCMLRSLQIIINVNILYLWCLLRDKYHQEHKESSDARD